MTLDSAAAIAELVGVAAILISLPYLAIQIRQSNDIATAEAEREILQSWMHGLEGLVDSNETTELFIRGLAEFDQLTPVEKTRLSYRLTELNMVFISALENEQKGLISARLVEAMGNVFFSYVVSPGGRRWWEITGKFMANAELVDKRLAEEGDTFPSILESLPYHWLDAES